MLEGALELHQAGRLAEAEDLYRKVLEEQPANADALHLLGVLSHQRGQHLEALALINRAIKCNSRIASYHNSLGEVLRALRRVNEAIAAYRKALDLRSDYAEAFNNLGLALASQGKFEDAVDVYRQALAYGSDAECSFHLGNALKDLGKADEAIVEYKHAIALIPSFSEAHANLGSALRQQGRIEESIDAYRLAVASNPDRPETHYNLGIALENGRDSAGAIAEYRRALELKPDFVEAFNNLGSVLRTEGLSSEAINVFERALALTPDAECLRNLGIALLDQARFDEAFAALERSLEKDPQFVDAHSILLFGLHYCERSTKEEIFARHRRWDAQHAASLRPNILRYRNVPDPSRSLRIGYVSPDFREHSVAYFIEPILANRERGQIDTYCYANVYSPDEITRRLRDVSGNWRDIVHLDDEQVAQQIRADEIDILVDLAGHSAGNRLLVFARQPAPVQVSYLGYPDTSGLEAIGYRFTDPHADPPGQADALHTETLIRLPHFLCYQPPRDAPSVGVLPARTEGRITFASFNNYSKITEAVVACWASILKTIPGSRLLLKARALADAGTRARAKALFGRYGVDGERVEMLPQIASTAQHLAVYNRVDIALDPFPYNGTTTTCEALWMGVPVITLEGSAHAGRVGVSISSAVGTPELVAQNVDEYIGIPVRLAQDLPRLEALRAGLRRRLECSALMDALGTTRAVEAAYRDIWTRYCQEVSQGTHDPEG